MNDHSHSSHLMWWSRKYHPFNYLISIDDFDSMVSVHSVDQCHSDQHCKRMGLNHDESSEHQDWPCRLLAFIILMVGIFGFPIWHQYWWYGTQSSSMIGTSLSGTVYDRTPTSKRWWLICIWPSCMITDAWRSFWYPNGLGATTRHDDACFCDVSQPICNIFHCKCVDSSLRLIPGRSDNPSSIPVGRMGEGRTTTPDTIRPVFRPIGASPTAWQTIGLA